MRRPTSCRVTAILYFIVKGEPQKGASGLFCSPPVRGDVWTSVRVWGALPLWKAAHTPPPRYIWSPPGRCWRRLRAEQPQKALSSLKSSWTNRKASPGPSINWWNNLKLWEALSRGKENVYKWCAIIPFFIHFWLPHPALFFLVFCHLCICLPSLLIKAKCGTVAQSACLWWGQQIHHMQLITVYLQCILSEHPDETKSLPYSHSVKWLCHHMNVPSASSNHIKSVLIMRSCAATTPFVASCAGFFFFFIRHPKTPSVDYSPSTLPWTSGHLH